LFADNLLLQSPENAYKLKMIDSIIYKDQCLNFLKQISGIKSNGKVKLVRLENYAGARLKQQPASSKRIAVIYAVGEILNTYGDQNVIGIENIPAAIKKAREDSRVKAIVLRVDSPGGDPTTSDIIWREIEITKKIKPVIVSMGRVAASGGYYISCGADTIVAEPTTLAGSIGVYGIIPNMQGFFNNKLGITFDRVTTGKYSDYFSLNRPLRADESKIVQSRIDKIYETFVSKVSIGRKMTYEEINEIAQGRVWSGLQAKNVGLVDVLGGLDDAIKIAAAKAKISGYSVVEYPALKSLVESILEDFPAEVKANLLQKELGGQYKYYQYLNRIKNYVGFRARLPFDMEVY
jgi:protease-4